MNTINKKLKNIKYLLIFKIQQIYKNQLEILTNKENNFTLNLLNL